MCQSKRVILADFRGVIGNGQDAARTENRAVIRSMGVVRNLSQFRRSAADIGRRAKI